MLSGFICLLILIIGIFFLSLPEQRENKKQTKLLEKILEKLEEKK
jgi:preprotein translocase subunit YajC